MQALQVLQLQQAVDGCRKNKAAVKLDVSSRGRQKHKSRDGRGFECG
jgi:hypothetical protein